MATDDKNPSFVLLEPNKLTYEDRPVPKLENPDDVLIHIQKTGICGSDVHYYLHGRIGYFIVKSPMTLGHESSGIVAETGSAVTSLKRGDRVALEPGVPCRRCSRCKEGRYNLCALMRFAATPPYDGTLARYYVLPADFCYKLPEHVSFEEGALIEPLSVAVHLCRQGGVKPGQSLVVFGAGPVGLLCCAVAKALGARKIIAVDIVPDRLAFALKYAATGVFTPGKTDRAGVNAARMAAKNDLGIGADVVIDASGAEMSIQTGISVLRAGGTFVQGGMGKPEITFPITEVCVKELVVKGSFRYGPGDYELAVGLLSRGEVSVKELVTSRVGFRDAERAFKEFGTGGGIKTVIGGVDE